MNFGLFAKSIGFSILQNSGIPVTPDQIGIKVTNPEALNGGFGSFLSGNTNTQISGPPTPPEPVTSDDPEEQAKYNEALLAYNQQFQLYNQQMHQLLLQRIQQIQIAQQQALRQQQQAQSSTDANNSNSSTFSTLGTGGIIGGDASSSLYL
ncbi:MAG: hypothetical protein KTR14_03145 [Vampirovibrio sp.]|nr:hypothetical protein [Vampirovibrio sp.]